MTHCSLYNDIYRLLGTKRIFSFVSLGKIAKCVKKRRVCVYVCVYQLFVSKRACNVLFPIAQAETDSYCVSMTLPYPTRHCMMNGPSRTYGPRRHLASSQCCMSLSPSVLPLALRHSPFVTFAFVSVPPCPYSRRD